MRISDWSSDVCSSDLPVRGVPHRRDRACGGRGNVALCDDAREPRPARRSAAQRRRAQGNRGLSDRIIRDGLCLDRLADAVPDDEGSLSPPYRRGRGGDVPGGRKRAFRRAQERADQDLREGEARSEEHTSELQSLMRISYAVLCLKKKKQKRQKRNNADNTVNSKNKQQKKK